MKPVDMITAHDPPHSFGDCYRACVASLLELPAEDVPHFFEEFDDADVTASALRAHDKLTAFLRPHGLYPQGFQVSPKHRDEWFDCTRGFYILGGTAPGRGTPHFVIARGRGTLVHDPHPTDKVGVGPDQDGSYVIVYFVRLFE